MKSNLLDFSKFENSNSKFTAELQERGGNITFSNSGKGGNKKFFNLSLETFLNCLKDIKTHLSEFVGHEDYIEGEWRNLGSKYFKDGPANAQITVQTKPMFTTLSKIIMWANAPTLDNINPEQYINLELSNLDKAITQLDELTNKFKPDTAIENEVTKVSSNSIRDFALMVFEHFYSDNWDALLNESQTRESTISGKKYIIYDHEWFKNLIGKFDKPQNKESLSSANTIRFFEKPIYINEEQYYYFTTQWNANGEYNLSFINLKNFIESKFPSYILTQEDKNFILSPKELTRKQENLKEAFADWLFNLGKYKRVYKNDPTVLIEKLNEFEKAYENDFGISIFSFPEFSLETIINELETNIIDVNTVIGDIDKRTVGNGSVKAILGHNNYIKFLKELLSKKHEQDLKSTNENKEKIKQIDFDLSFFNVDCKNSGLNYKPELITRYVSSLVTKPFVLLSGLSGSGKTKLAQAFAQWICESEEQYCIVPVGADWTNREPLLGYVNALTPTEYILPENGALDLIIKANNDQEKPYFLILDEMNLSHVERYFADFLSVMESEDKFKLHSSSDPLNGNNNIKVENEYDWPKNLFIVGTVNIDETTYMFSPKVLDRANVIEFRVSEPEMSDYFINSKPLDLKKLNGEDGIPLGAKYGEDFVKIATHKTSDTSDQLTKTLKAFFVSLQKVGAEFGYRTASEIQTLFGQIDKINPDFDKSENFDKQYPNKENFKIDVAIMQKLLPKLHGSRNKLVPVLTALAVLCYGVGNNNKLSKEDKNEVFKKRDELKGNIIYPISLEKIERMYDNVIANGFTSYAEA